MEKVKLTAEQWELYTVSMPCGRVAMRLNKIVNDAISRTFKDAQDIGLKDAFYKNLCHAEAQFDEFAQYGASDTEPRYHLYDQMRRAVKIDL